MRFLFVSEISPSREKCEISSKVDRLHNNRIKRLPETISERDNGWIKISGRKINCGREKTCAYHSKTDTFFAQVRSAKSVVNAYFIFLMGRDAPRMGSRCTQGDAMLSWATVTFWNSIFFQKCSETPVKIPKFPVVFRFSKHVVPLKLL